ncbi:RICIN domain-containing protein [Streptomyces sp. NPDC018057]|uniref:RICIN domain-containing protein n=1 Tax=unclassified Streptomyces TaxID=2593676 RepID=UPI0037A69B1A
MLFRKTLAAAAATAGLVGTGLFAGASPASAGVLPPTPADAIRIANYNSGKCLEIADWRTDNGAPARQWDCTGGNNQLWYVTDSSGIGTTLVNKNSGKCLEIADWRTDDGAPARQWDCTGNRNQEWNYDHAVILGSGAASYLKGLSNLNSGKCVVIQGATNGSPAFQYSCTVHSYADQWWYDDRVLPG